MSDRTVEAVGHYSFSDLVRKFGDTRIDVLKIDIEGRFKYRNWRTRQPRVTLGGEFKVIDQILRVPICHVLIEIHSKAAYRVARLLQRFAQKGFLLYAFEGNMRYFHLREYSFLHESCLEQYGVKTVLGRWLS